MKIALLEPFYTGSHKRWADTVSHFSTHDVRIFSLPGRHWKWRMHGGAVSIARQFLGSGFIPELILATDMIDLSIFLSLTRKTTASVPTAIFFHENQLTYPWSDTDPDPALKRDNHYGFINYTSALAAGHVLFNSTYHLNSFVDALPIFLRQFPDEKNIDTVDSIKVKSSVLPLLIDFSQFIDIAMEAEHYPEECVILWNHRWEYDKNPEGFFHLIYQLKERGLPFKLIVLGEAYRQSPPIFDEAKQKLKDHILHWGYADDSAEYARLLSMSDILPVTSNQDFFGGSVVEAIFANVMPILPNRLAYPGHIPISLSSVHLFDSEEELLHMTVNAISNLNDIRNRPYRHFVEHYDARKMIKDYDAFFERLASE